MIKLLSRVRPRGLVILAACANVAEILGRTIHVTSGNDSKHMIGSKHYVNEALDIRSKDFPNSTLKYIFVGKVLERLGDNYQGFLEDENGPNEHFHFEYDPKKPTNKSLRNV